VDTVSSLGSGNNAILVSNGPNLIDLIVTLQVTEDLVTQGNTGFSLQLNAYPQVTSSCQGQSLNWFQYIIYVGGPVNNQVGWEIQYWSIGAPGSWPPGYTPNPPNTTPWLPVLPNDSSIQSFGPAPSNQIPAGSVMQISLVTDADINVTAATFSVTNPSGNVSNATYTFPSGAIYPIYGFQVDIVGPGGGALSIFRSGAGTLTYSIYGGETLAVQGAGTAGPGLQPGTGESSNLVYGDVMPASGTTVSQDFQTPKGIEMSESVVVVRKDGTEDRFDVMPDGTGRHVATSNPPSGQPLSDDVLPGSWSKFYSAWWVADGTLHVRGYGWLANQGGQVFEVVWSNGQWGTPFQPNNI
jgi:hypothetical protein